MHALEISRTFQRKATAKGAEANTKAKLAYLRPRPKTLHVEMSSKILEANDMSSMTPSLTVSSSGM